MIPIPPVRQRWKNFAWIPVVAVAYYLLARFGLSLAFFNKSASAVWPPTGAAIAAVLFLGPRVLPGVFIGALFANLSVSGVLWTSVAIAAGNTAEALLAAWFTNSFAHGLNAFDRPYNILKYVLFASVASTAVCAGWGTTMLCAGRLALWGDFAVIFWTWWLGDMVGAVVITPLIIFWLIKPPSRGGWRKALEAVLLAATALLVTQVIFGGGSPGSHGYPLGYLCIPIVLWAAFRFDQRISATVVLMILALALRGTLMGYGPFSVPEKNQSLFFLQTFGATIAIMALVLSAVVEEVQRSRRGAELQYAIARLLAGSEGVESALSRVLQHITQFLGWDCAMVWMPDERQSSLRYVQGWVSPKAKKATAFLDANRRITHYPGVGQPGRVWKSGEPLWIENVAADANFTRAQIAEQCGLRGTFAFPFYRGGQFGGVLEFFSRRVEKPNPELLLMIASTGNQISQFMERQRMRRNLERRVAELQTKERELRLITDSVPVMISYVDHEERYRFANRAYEDWFGRPRQPLFGKKVREILGDKAYDTVKTHMRRALGGQRVTFERQLNHQGREHHIQASYVPEKGSDGRVRGFFAVLADITQTKRAEEGLLRTKRDLEARTAELEAANRDLMNSNRELEQFAYVASHDLQEPLRKIITFSDYLKEKAPNLDASEKEYFVRMNHAAERMRTVIEDLLNFSRVSRETEHEPVELGEVLKEVMTDLEVLVTSAGASVRIGVMPRVMANKTQMHHVFQNLISNAVKFAKKGEPAAVSIEAVDAGPGMACVKVSDNGIGFDEKYKEKIFQPFERLNPRDSEGSGIGLTIVQKIVQNHGGKVAVKSEPGKGAEFFLTLPLARSDLKA